MQKKSKAVTDAADKVDALKTKKNELNKRRCSVSAVT